MKNPTNSQALPPALEATVTGLFYQGSVQARKTLRKLLTDWVVQDQTQGEYVARIEVCKTSPTNYLAVKNAKNMATSYKPIGLLQVYGDDDQIFFGLLTGSFAKNISGGVLRKNADSFADEINNRWNL